ncbi:MAG: leader peptidase (prepilin peptidase) / N-methyltransferase [Patescibacteria group bacterium]|nr:leader peptidase (prepilin peptidase) / N-methyltransferase [Patescibacteria group bacterium]
MTIIIFFIFGLIIGSFLNVLAYRISIAETILGRSFCPKCKKQISWYDNVPLLSFILLRAKCRNCKKKISWQYPLMELFTAAIFAGIGAKFFDAGVAVSWIETGYYLTMASALIVIFIYDWLYMEIPGIVLWPAIFAAVGFNLWLDWNGVSDLGEFGNVLSLGWLGMLGLKTPSGVLAAAAAFTFFFSLSAMSREKWMGMGDAYLAILLGLILGWPQILLALFLAFAIGAIYGIILISLKKKKMKSQIPFAPFLIAGTLIAIFFHQPIISWYLGLFIV